MTAARVVPAKDIEAETLADVQADASRPIGKSPDGIGNVPGFPVSLREAGTGNAGKGRTIHLADMPEPAPRDWLISRVLPVGCTSCIFGDGGSGKSLVSLHLAFCLAQGIDFFGFTVKKKTKVFFLDFEQDDDEFARRGYHIARGMGLSAIPTGIYYRRATAALTDPEMFATAKTEVANTGAGLTIIDSVAVASGASDQIATSEVIPFMDKIRELGTLLLVDHIAKPNGNGNGPPTRAYGSTYKHNLVRSSFRLDRADGGGRRLSHEKHNYTEQLKPIDFAMAHTFDAVRFQSVAGDDDRLAGIYEKPKPIAERITEELSRYGDAGATAKQLAKLLGITAKTASNHLTTLRSRTRVEPAAITGQWRITSKAAR
jgi:hypothetical protein